ncbi:MAG TPA: DUF4190 domain-containing protein [Pirellulaceae bacterium]|jgi:hypothetical protein|nr:DUF4190 domain-containing protein [Pirellulaceae bacterium]
MPIHIACPHCRQPLRIPAEAENTTIQCPHCHGISRVPTSADAKPPPAAPPPDPARNPWAGITSMVVGIVGLAFSCLPMCSAPLGVVAVVFALVGLMYYKGGRGMATAGLVLGACGIMISVTLVIVALMWPPPITPVRQEPAKVSFRPTKCVERGV